MIPTLEKLADNTKLKISLNPEDREDLAFILKEYGSINAWYNLMEHALCNGWQDCRDRIACCSNPYMITDDYTYTDDLGNELEEPELCGRVYYYNSYEVACPIEELLDRGYIILNSAE